MYIFLATSTATEIATTAAETIETINNSSGLKLDLTVTISVIIALCSIFSNLITAWLNNCHQARMKKIELNQQHYENTVLHQRTVIENYLKATGKCIHHDSADNRSTYGECYYLARTYVDEEIASEMRSINYYIYNEEFEAAAASFEALSSKMHTSLKTL